MPSFLSVEPSAICQLRCPECPCGQGVHHPMNTEKMMSLSTFSRVLKQCQGWVHTIQLYFQGEPLLNPHLPQMIHLAHQAHIHTICSTNAQALTPLLSEQLVQAGLDRIIVSIDGLSEDSYQSYRVGGSLNRALQGLVYLREAKNNLGGRTHIELQCLRLHSNEHEWEMFSRTYRQMGADSLTFKTAQFYDYQHGNPLMPRQEKYSRYHLTKEGLYIPKNRMHSLKNHPCARILSGCVITVNGDVLPCCFDKSGQYVMGNILTHSLHDIWHSALFAEFRQRIRLDRMTSVMCTNCTE